MTELTAPRTHLIQALEADLIGPFRRNLKDADGKDGIDSVEELGLPPSRWYLTGFLAPEGAMDEEAPERRALLAALPVGVRAAQPVGARRSHTRGSREGGAH